MRSDGPADFVLGGQAVIEGVMMKGQSTYAVAVRTPGGEILVRDFPIRTWALGTRVRKTPVVRGVVAMAGMLAIGYRALQFSADVAAAEPESREAFRGDSPGGGLMMGAAAALALLFGLVLFFLLPLVATRGVATIVPALSGPVAFNLVDGLFRVAAFVAYVLAIGLMKDIRRLFQYHGAEHKVVNAFEDGAVLSPEAVAPYSCLHPRCGTSFLLFVMVVSIAVFAAVPHGSTLAVKALMRLLLLPAVAGISYEALRYSAKRLDRPVVRALIAPGLLLQRLTTREPTPAQIEVAIASSRSVTPGKGGEGSRA